MEIDNQQLILIVIIINVCLLITVGVTTILILQRKFVKENSNKYHEVLEVERHYSEYAIAEKPKHVNVILDSLNKYRSFNPYQYILKDMDIRKNRYVNCLSRCQLCRNMQVEYSEKIERIYQRQSTSIEELPSYLRWQTFYDLERKLMDKHLLVIPTDFVIMVNWSYQSPAGRNSYLSSAPFGYDDIVQLLQQKEDSELYKTTSQYQRSKMTASLRTKILERDNRRCTICGASASDGIMLHIDHIVPISQGGKTIEHNLRVLCDRCNLGKSDKLLPGDSCPEFKISNDDEP